MKISSLSRASSIVAIAVLAAIGATPGVATAAPAPSRTQLIGVADGTESAGNGTNQVFLRNIDAESRVDRLGGADRFAVSAAVSSGTFAPGASVAFVASGEVFPDAQSGSAAAGLARGPVLLVQKDAVPGVIAAELERLKPSPSFCSEEPRR